MAADTLRAMAHGRACATTSAAAFIAIPSMPQWRVPHFEKMLYDQAQLTLAYLEAAQATGEDFYATVAEDTLVYVMRDLTDPEGGFYSAEDADSVPPEQAGAARGRSKSEGAFYIWSDAEIGEVDRRRCRHRAAAIWHRSRRQRAAGSAGRVHAARTFSTSRSRSTTSPRAPALTPTASSTRSAARAEMLSRRGSDDRGRTSTTRS